MTFPCKIVCKAAVWSISVCFWMFQLTALSAEDLVPERFGPWDDVSGFAIHPNESYIIIAMEHEGREQLFESRLHNGAWSTPTPIEAINNHAGGYSNIGGPYLDFGAKSLIFHADYPGGEGGFDLYRSTFSQGVWGVPESLGALINTESDELYPTMIPGETKLMFSRDNSGFDSKKPRRTPDCQVFYASFKDFFGQWELPRPLHDAINMGCVYGIGMAVDGKTIYFSAVDEDNHREGFNLYHAREITRGSWVLPVPIDQVASEHTLINPRQVGDHLYYLVQMETRRGTSGSIYRVKLPAEFRPLPVQTVNGTIRMRDNQEPIHTRLTVFDPINLNVLGEFDTDPESGTYAMPLLDHANYIVDIRSPGHSFASFQPDFRSEEKLFGPGVIDLFDQVQLYLSVYDAEIFRPLDARVWANNMSGSQQQIEGRSVSPGMFSLTLPIGEEYSIQATAGGFHHDGFGFSLMDDVIFGRFYRDLPLDPVKIPVTIIVRDEETLHGVAAEVSLSNLDREEEFLFHPHQLRNGQINTELRDNNFYELSVRGSSGYAFYNDNVRVHQNNSTIYIDLRPLRAQTTIVLNNIHFVTNSADLTTESFQELDRVVELIQNNPSIIIEISAHTDNVGSDAYNMLLSDRRAQSVVNYLRDNNVPERRMIARGYGLRRPLVPNTSEENRAINRRVEFTIIEIEDHTE